MENGKIHKYKGKTLDEIDLNFSDCDHDAVDEPSEYSDGDQIEPSKVIKDAAPKVNYIEESSEESSKDSSEKRNGKSLYFNKVAVL